MGERTLVPIFVFWTFLTIITPTLILLSENSKADLDLNGQDPLSKCFFPLTSQIKYFSRDFVVLMFFTVYVKFTGNITEGVKQGRMIRHTHRENYIIKTAPKDTKFEEESAPAPEPLPTTATVTPTVSLSHQNRTLKHNTTHARIEHLKVKQTNIR